MVMKRLAQNHIYFFRDIGGRKIVSSSEMKAHTEAYFQSIFGHTDMRQSPCSLDFLKGLLPFRCSVAQSEALCKAVTEDEIVKTVFSMPINKAPGPDGYSAEFFRSSWPTVGPLVIEAVTEFFRNGRLLKDLNTTIVALIPKTVEASCISDFRLISCCNFVYKVISKIIANRIKPILTQCISPNQAAFQKGRSLGENVLLTGGLNLLC